MKSLQELYDEVKGDDTLKKSFAEAMRDGVAEEFLRKHGCEATLEELREFLESKVGESGPLELSTDELVEVAGGTSYYCGEPCSRGDTSDCSDRSKFEALMPSQTSPWPRMLVSAAEVAAKPQHVLKGL